MKKLVLMAAAIVAVSFASCGSKAANNATEAANAEATEVVAEPAAEAEAAAPAAQADSVKTDSTQVAE